MRNNGRDHTDDNDEEGNAALIEENYSVFRDCLQDIVIQRLSPQSDTKKKRAKARKNQIKPVEQSEEDANAARTNDAEDLGDFIEYIASELFPSLPLELRTLSYAAIRNDPQLSATWSPPLPLSSLEQVAALLPPTTIDSLNSYSLLPSTPTPTSSSSSHPTNHASKASDFTSDILLPSFLSPLLTAYTSATTTPPPSVVLPHTASTRPSACEICDRDWIPLTYHHLIPRQMHAKALKRGWHEEWELNNVAWICRACHSFVHRVASNEELAREWFTVERLCGREDVRRWGEWVGRIRWRKM